MRNRIVKATSRILLVSILLAGFATLMAPGLSSAQTAPTKRVVRCYGFYAAKGTPDQMYIMRCTSGGFGSFTTVPSGQFLSITDVHITPTYYGSTSTSVTSIRLKRWAGSSSDSWFSISYTGESTLQESYRSPPLVLLSGTQLAVTISLVTNTTFEVVVTGVLTSDYDGSAN